MAHFTDNPIAYAERHMAEQDGMPHNYDHTCTGCREGFDSGCGQAASDEKFCNSCLDHHRHFEYYREAELSDAQIFELSNQLRSI